MGAFDTFMSDTVGVVWRAGTGTVDPWTKNEIVDNEAQSVAQASNGTISVDDARTQAQQAVTDQLSGFSLGPGDTVGADPSQAKLSVPSLPSLKNALADLNIPTWVYWVGGGVALLLVLGTLAPYARILGGRD